MTIQTFSLSAPLPAPRTTTVIEASAGTGKTHAIAALVARFVAAGTPLSQILAVTFSRLATAELRDGIRERLVQSHHTLLHGSPVDPGDPVDVWLCACPDDQRADRLALMEEALNEIDAAAIVTLHTFAKRMLDELGLLADHDRATELGADLEVLADEVVRDCFLSEQRWQQLGWEYAAELGRAAINHRAETLHPVAPSTAVRAEFAAQVRAEFDRRKRRRRVMDYDDMVDRLTATLADAHNGERAAALLSAKFPVVLVDEFQDTDPQQWQFLRQGFDKRSTMILIGDPKQAIYRFRGGDIETYTRARDAALCVQTMVTNFRSDEPVVRGVEQIFGRANLGMPDSPITTHPVDVSHRGSRLADDRGAVRVRLLDSNRALKSWHARPQICQDVVSQILLLTTGGTQITVDGRRRGVRAGDVAVLVTANFVGQQIHDALADAGIPAVFSGSSSVYASPAAKDWLTVLEALEDASRYRLRRALLTRLLGWSSADVAAASGDELIEMTALITRCARLVADQGIASVFETLVAERNLYDRLLTLPDGEGLVTDLRHLSEILNEAQSDQALSASGLTEFLRRRINRANADTIERARRLPTDRPAVRILTVHQAKGLQFPIVLLPQASEGHVVDLGKDLPMVGHLDGERILDLATPDQRPDNGAAYLAEELAEDLRKFYVACTRAESLLICWWAPTERTQTSALHRLLMNEGAAAVPDAGPFVPKVSLLPRPTGVDFESIAPSTGIRPSAPRPIEQDSTPARLLEARVFRDRIDRDWTRTSYTGLTSEIHGLTVAGFDEPLEIDQEEATAGTPPSEPPAGLPVSALADQPGGVQFGSLVHAVLEAVDPAAPNLPVALSAAVQPLVERFALPGLDPAALVAGLGQTLETPLGVLTSGRSLRDLGAGRRLAELDFELPLGSGQARSKVADLAALFAGLPAGDPLRHYGQLLGSSAAADSVLAGFLTGSIDVVLQIPDTQPRYVILDYKTNRVPTAPDEVLTAHHYSPTAMTRAMCESHYPLQALLYGVALHRYLAWRQPGYDPELHLGGVGYLFVRGMVGPDTPVLGTMPAGVFTWQPPAAIFVAASEVLTGGRR